MQDKVQGAVTQGRQDIRRLFATANYASAAEDKNMIGAIYARYSDDQQKATSIDDQVRACLELAERHGVVVHQDLIFADEAFSGGKLATHKREQYHALRDAVKAGKVRFLLCDQQCRLARHAKEALDFFEDLKEHRVRLLTADGMDSDSPTGALLYGVKSVFSEFFLDETRHRIKRSMRGGFARGSMVTAVPFGYVIDHDASAKAGLCCWRKDPEAATVVQEIFDARYRGMSFNQIAAILNMRNVATPRGGDGDGKRTYWRASAIWRILRNPIYKGLYQVNFGGKNSPDATLDQRIVPELALVSAEVWAACQKVDSDAAPVGRRRAGYGGGKHPLAGVIRCGVCGVPLSCHHAKDGGGSMHCIQCEHATAAGIAGRKPLHVSIKGIRVMLQYLIMKVVQGPALERYRELLRERLEGGRANELAEVRQRLEKAVRSQVRMARLLKVIDDEDPVLQRQYVEAREEVLRLTDCVTSLEAHERAFDHEALQRQLAVDAAVVAEEFLSDEQSPERTRTLLNRLFPSIVLKTKTDRYTAIFAVTIKAGALLADAAETIPLDAPDEEVCLELNTSGSKHPVWTVKEVSASSALDG